MNAHDVVLISDVVRKQPVLLELLQQHVDDFDQLLPHVFMAELTRWLAQRFAEAPTDPAVKSSLAVLELAMDAGRVDDRELIVASFLENLPRTTGAPSLRDALGPALRSYLVD